MVVLGKRGAEEPAAGSDENQPQARARDLLATTWRAHLDLLVAGGFVVAAVVRSCGY